MHDELGKVDPKAAARIHPNDPQRLQRALEVYRVSGQTLTELHAREANDGEGKEQVGSATGLLRDPTP